MTAKSKPNVRLSPVAFGDLKNLHGNLRRQIIIAIDELEENPRPSKSAKLKIEDEVEKFAVYDWVNGELFMLSSVKNQSFWECVGVHPMIMVTINVYSKTSSEGVST